MVARRLWVLASVFTFGCATPPATAPDDAPSDAPPGGAGGADDATRRTDFLAGCVTELPGADDYCACSWVAFRGLFSNAEMDGEPDANKLQQLQQLVRAKCTDSLPEERIRDGFMLRCAAHPARAAYCGCMYGELRKDLSPSDMAADETASSPKFLAARKRSVGVCGSKVPEKVIHDEFMAACAKAPELEKFCGCAWKVVRSKASPAEIDSNEADMTTIKPLIDTACASLRP
jgi:hypothetical protein